MYQSILNFRRGRYLWIAVLLSIASIAAYYWHDPISQPNGGTWLGYTLGTIGALIIVWLMFLGVRKRSYSSSLGTVQGWTSAHVYLGTALLLVASLHAGFQFGWNIHTLAYCLMVVVIFSGFFGIYVYIRYPNLMTENRAGQTLDQLIEKVHKIEEKCLRDAHTADLQSLVISANDNCEVGGSWWQQLTARDASTISIPPALEPEAALGAPVKLQSNVDQKRVIDCLANRLSELSGGSEAGVVQTLLASFAAKQTLLQRIRRDIQIRALLKIWLFFHVPLSFGLLAALMVHVVVVFYYW